MIATVRDNALPVAHDLPHVDVLVTPDHKFLLNAGRGMGYCYLSPAVQGRFTPINAGWRAGSVPFDSFFGPEMNLSATASRFDNSISWLAAIGNQAALTIFDDFGPSTIYARNHELTTKLRAALTNAGWNPVDLPEHNQSTIVSVPLGDANQRGFLPHCPSRESSAQRGTATCALRSTSITTKTTSNDSPRP